MSKDPRGRHPVARAGWYTTQAFGLRGLSRVRKDLLAAAIEMVGPGREGHLPPMAFPPILGRVVQFFQSKPHRMIPFEPSARERLLRAQLEQTLLATASREEEGAGEAQHGAAAVAS